MTRKPMIKRLFPIWIVLGVTAVGGETGQAQPTATAGAVSAAGRWTGRLGQIGRELDLTLNISQAADGRFKGSIEGLEQGGSSNELEGIEQRDRNVKMVIGVIGGGFQGVLSDDGTKLTGTWSELAITTPLEFVRAPMPEAGRKP